MQRTREENEVRIDEILTNVGRAGTNKLIQAMHDGGFYSAPCSGAYHLCEEGGLAEHTVNVHDKALELAMLWTPDDMEGRADFLNSVSLCAVLHDLGKMGDHHKPNYTPNYVRSKTKNKETGEYDLVQSEAKPYETNKELNYEEHEIRSVIIAERYIELTEDEETAILHHNGCWGKLDSSFSSYYDKHLLSFIIHTADLFCSRFEEV